MIKDIIVGQRMLFGRNKIMITETIEMLQTENAENAKRKGNYECIEIIKQKQHRSRNMIGTNSRKQYKGGTETKVTRVEQVRTTKTRGATKRIDTTISKKYRRYT